MHLLLCADHAHHSNCFNHFACQPSLSVSLHHTTKLNNFLVSYVSKLVLYCLLKRLHEDFGTFHKSCDLNIRFKLSI
ncbi:hypothetical protein VIGAN_09169900 [Vigna angularis var. angularis]|uniref:Uncharacterized protein n=1 Tax=Vigna angularis var. angularis TaxID=157739 RepID=A0A0S3SZF9_PHAAN|nr:hypothetical protein VIGAN_09169900 [Vigna angularis var. angularis]